MWSLHSQITYANFPNFRIILKTLVAPVEMAVTSGGGLSLY